MDTLTISRQKDGSWKAQSNGKSVSFTLHSGNPLTALQSFIGWSSWSLNGAPMPKRIRAFIRATQPSLIEHMESGYRAACAELSLAYALDMAHGIVR